MMARALCRPRPRVLSCPAAIFAALLFTLLPAFSLAAAGDSPPTVRDAPLREHLDRLDAALALRLERLARLPAEERPSDGERRAEAMDLHRHLTGLEAMVRRAAPAATEAFLERIHGLEGRVRELERWPEARAGSLVPALNGRGTISGTVTDEEAGGEPIFGLSVLLWDAAGAEVAHGFTGEDGRYAFADLGPGTYFVTTEDSFYRDELFDDLPCPQGGHDCNPTSGTPVAVSDGGTADGIDFALARRAGISGTVTEAATGEPIAFMDVWLFDPNGALSQRTIADGDGFYAFGGLPPGVYFVYTREFFPRYINEVYDDLPCLPECDPAAGTPVTVHLDEITSGIDFALRRLGVIEGTVTDSVTGEPVIGTVFVRAYDTAGELVGGDVVGFGGSYQIEGVSSGEYFLTTESTAYFDELYDDFPCLFGGCDPTDGTPVSADIEEVTSGIDFVLTPLPCMPSATALCLNEGRFRVELEWAGFDHQGGAAAGEQLTDDSGYFTFFDSANIEVVVKVLRACFGPNPRYWVFAGGLTNLEVALHVRDTVSGEEQIYTNALGEAFVPVQDTAHFAVCR